jgi:hypothetical protein
MTLCYCPRSALQIACDLFARGLDWTSKSFNRPVRYSIGSGRAGCIHDFNIKITRKTRHQKRAADARTSLMFKGGDIPVVDRFRGAPPPKM